MEKKSVKLMDLSGRMCYKRNLGEKSDSQTGNLSNVLSGGC